jgi:hypothetical protein
VTLPARHAMVALLVSALVVLITSTSQMVVALTVVLSVPLVMDLPKVTVLVVLHLLHSGTDSAANHHVSLAQIALLTAVLHVRRLSQSRMGSA